MLIIKAVFQLQANLTTFTNTFNLPRMPIISVRVLIENLQCLNLIQKSYPNYLIHQVELSKNNDLLNKMLIVNKCKNKCKLI